MLISLKPGTRLGDLRPQLVMGVLIVWSHYNQFETDVIITSSDDRVHSWRSDHYKGDALDIRSKNLPLPDTAKIEFAAKLGQSLGPDFILKLEFLGEAEEHFHLAWKP